MQIKFTYAQQTVYNLLSTEKVNCLSIVDLCKLLKVNRQKFYKRYGNKTKFLTLCIIQTIHDEMKNHNHRSLTDYLYHLLLHVEKEKIFYQNMLCILRKSCICSHLKIKLFELIWTKMGYKDKMTYVFVEEMTNLIYAHLFIWINHNCEQKSGQILKEIETLVARLKHIDENPDFIIKVAEEARTYLWGDKDLEEV